MTGRQGISCCFIWQCDWSWWKQWPDLVKFLLVIQNVVTVTLKPHVKQIHVAKQQRSVCNKNLREAKITIVYQPNFYDRMMVMKCLIQKKSTLTNTAQKHTLWTCVFHLTVSLITGIAESNAKQTPPLSVICCFGGLVDLHTSDAVGLIRAHSVAVPHLLTWLQKEHAMHTNSENRCCEASIDKREESEHNVEQTQSKISYLTSLWTAEHLHWNKPTTFKDSGLIPKAGVFLNWPSFHFIIGNTATKCGNIKQKLCEKKKIFKTM